MSELVCEEERTQVFTKAATCGSTGEMPFFPRLQGISVIPNPPLAIAVQSRTQTFEADNGISLLARLRVARNSGSRVETCACGSIAFPVSDCISADLSRRRASARAILAGLSDFVAMEVAFRRV